VSNQSLGGWIPPQHPQRRPGFEPPPPPPRKKRRVFMWVILAMNALFLVWVIVGLAQGSSCTGMTGDELTACATGEGIGKGVAVFLIVLFWALVDVILGVVYMVTRRR
jgi:hypothetical protein